MSQTGKFSFNFASGTNNLCELIYQALLKARGSAYEISDEENNLLTIESYAYAKALTSQMRDSVRMTNQFDMSKVTVFMQRWYDILGFVSSPTESDVEKRAKLVNHFKFFTKPPTPQAVADYCNAVIGSDVFQEIRYKDANDNEGSVPGGVTIPGGVTLPDGPWTSKVAHILIVVTYPGNITRKEFNRRIGILKARLDSYLPAYMQYEVATSVGFQLVRAHKLDGVAIDV